MGPASTSRIGREPWPASLGEVRREPESLVGVMATRRWLDWAPQAEIAPACPDNELTKPTKGIYVSSVGSTSGHASVSVGFDSSTLGHADDAEITRAMRLLNLAGARILDRQNIGLWSDLDCPEIRNALAVVGMDGLPTIHLDTAADIPMRYKVRACPVRFLGESFAAWLRRAEKAQPKLVAAYAEGSPA